MIVMRYLSGSPLLVVKSDIVGLTVDGIPKHLGALIPYLQSQEPRYIKLILTILQLSKFIKYNGVPDTQPITEPPRVNLETPLQEYTVLLPKILKSLGIGRLSPIWKSGHLTTKSGPMGIALVSANAEAKIMPKDLRNSIGYLGGLKLLEWLDSVTKIPESEITDKIPKIKTLRKLSVIHDPEGKTRVIAILDYWSQNALKPLHDLIFQVLKGIKMDCTFNQDSFVPLIPHQGEFNSLDLTSCTDRLPALLQKELVYGLLGSRKMAQS
jgi:hypothetical protein